MDGEFIADRLMPKIIADICRKNDIDCTATADKWILRLQRDKISRWIIGYTFDINSASAAQIAKDKAAAYFAMSLDHVPAIEHFLVQAADSSRFLDENVVHLNPRKPVVVKPLRGSSGVGIRRFESLDKAKKYILESVHREFALCPWYDIVSETRVMILDDAPLLVYEKTNPQIKNGVKLFNLGRGAAPRLVSPNQNILKLAKQGMRSCNLRLASTDVVTFKDGSHAIMEINDGIMMEHFARQSTEQYDIAKSIYEEIVIKMMEPY